MKILIYTEDGKPTSETDSLIKTLKSKGDIYYRSIADIKKEPADIVYSDDRRVRKIYLSVKPIKSPEKTSKGVESGK